MSERVVNIAELEAIIEECCILAAALKKENPDSENFLRLTDLLAKARDFEFKIERRKTSYCE